MFALFQGTLATDKDTPKESRRPPVGPVLKVSSHEVAIHNYNYIMIPFVPPGAIARVYEQVRTSSQPLPKHIASNF